jgi:hypothetical protein
VPLGEAGEIVTPVRQKPAAAWDAGDRLEEAHGELSKEREQHLSFFKPIPDEEPLKWKPKVNWWAIIGLGAILILAVFLVTRPFLGPKQEPATTRISDTTVTAAPTVASMARFTDEEIRKQNDIALAKIHTNESPTPTPPPTAKPSPSSNEYLSTEAWAGSDFQVVRKTWEKGGFDTVAIWHVTIKNLTNRPIGNFRYTTDYQSETGVNHGSHFGRLEKRLEAGQTKTFEFNDGFVYSQADRAGVDIIKGEFLGEPESKSHKVH